MQPNMNQINLQKAKAEAIRFLDRVKDLETCDSFGMVGARYYYPSKHTGAVKRASLDLTRALAEMRKPN